MSSDPGPRLRALVENLVKDLRSGTYGQRYYIEHDSSDCVASTLEALLRASASPIEPVTTFTPLLWVFMSDEQKYEEYIRVRASASAPPPTENRSLQARLNTVIEIVAHAECSDPENCRWDQIKTMCVRCRIRDLFQQAEQVGASASAPPRITYPCDLCGAHGRCEHCEATPTEFDDDAQRTVKSIATMLGWVTVPPRRILEKEIAILKERAKPVGASASAPPPDQKAALTQLVEEAQELGIYDDDDEALTRSETLDSPLVSSPPQPSTGLSGPKTEICICAAIQMDNGVILRGHRHDDCFNTALKYGYKERITSAKQGFVTSRNRFVSRELGAAIQQAAGIKSAHTGQFTGLLFSEDLYFNDAAKPGGASASAVSPEPQKDETP